MCVLSPTNVLNWCKAFMVSYVTLYSICAIYWQHLGNLKITKPMHCNVKHLLVSLLQSLYFLVYTGPLLGEQGNTCVPTHTLSLIQTPFTGMRWQEMRRGGGAASMLPPSSIQSSCSPSRSNNKIVKFEFTLKSISVGLAGKSGKSNQVDGWSCENERSNLWSSPTVHITG